MNLLSKTQYDLLSKLVDKQDELGEKEVHQMLIELISDIDKFDEYIKELYIRKTDIQYKLSQSQIEVIAEKGPCGLSLKELVNVLLSPCALNDLLQYLHNNSPEWWMNPFATAGRDICKRYGINLKNDLRMAFLNVKKANTDKAKINAAAQTAMALGYCRLYKFSPEEYDGILPTEMAISALIFWNARVIAAIKETNELPDRWYNAEPPETDDLCIGLLTVRTQALAVTLATEESLVKAELKGSTKLVELRKQLLMFVQSVHELDKALELQIDTLSTITGLSWLDNQRILLGNEDSLPWWLDYRLEIRSQEIAINAKKIFNKD